MSKNYTKYSKPEVLNVPTPDAENIETPDTEEVVETEQLTADVEEQEPAPAEPKTGVVTANKLNIRKLPGLNAEVATTVTKGTELMIDPTFETVEWLKVYTNAGLEGYCMKKFIDVK